MQKQVDRVFHSFSDISSLFLSPTPNKWAGLEAAGFFLNRLFSEQSWDQPTSFVKAYSVRFTDWAKFGAVDSSPQNLVSGQDLEAADFFPQYLLSGQTWEAADFFP